MIRAFWGGICAGAIAACTPVAPAQTVALAGGDVSVTTPAGYCVDGQASTPRNGFAVLAPCATLGAQTGAPSVIGVATVQVGAPESGTIMDDEAALRDFLITDAGNALLSSEGEGADVTILSTQAFDNQVMVHFADAGPAPLAGLQPEEWRAFTRANGRLVTIAVRGLAQAPLQDGPGAGLLKLVISGVKAVTSAAPAATPAAI
ncbi:dihydroxy-acid dehydratase [Yoonia sp. BS5-3]|uniref:Dihydroxy-acid dehydratase n=1 Tax=Yoonia phaeophyticola TaxID=3137369 RepID=A0ABZ2V5H0_9RHOB